MATENPDSTCTANKDSLQTVLGTLQSAMIPCQIQEQLLRLEKLQPRKKWAGHWPQYGPL